jgi:hypothetical protein
LGFGGMKTVQDSPSEVATAPSFPEMRSARGFPVAVAKFPIFAYFPDSENYPDSAKVVDFPKWPIFPIWKIV